MTFTYTYTARSKDNLEHVATFTIMDDVLKVNLTGLFDQVSDVVEAEDQEQAAKHLLKSQSDSAMYKFVERLSGPVHVKDVSPSFDNEEFSLTFWKRIAGLRVAPLIVMMGEVDNPEAARQFIETLREQQEIAEAPNVFSGPLDYWVTWIALLIGIFILIKWPREKKSE
jgi:hypothetical protein